MSVVKPPVGVVDHNVLHVPFCKTVSKREKSQTKNIRVGSEESTASLQGCQERTHWDIFMTLAWI